MAHLDLQVKASKASSITRSRDTRSILEILQASVVAHQAGQLESAEKGYRQALAQQPRNIDALQLLGVLLHQKGETQAGLDLLGRALEIDPENARCNTNIGSIYNKLGDFEKAESHFAVAIKASGAPAEAWCNMGVAQKRKRNFDGAVESLRRARKIDPDYGEAARVLGLIYLERHKFDLAEPELRAYLATNPDDSCILNNLAYSVQMQGRLDEAEALFGEAIDRAGNSPHLDYNMRTLLVLQGREEEARELFRKQLLENPDSWTAELGLALGLAMRGKDKDALQNMDDILKFFPDNPKVWSDIGYVLMVLDKNVQAVVVLSRALELDPNNVNACNNLGLSYSRLHAHWDAVKYFKQAIAIDPTNINAYLNASRSLRSVAELDQSLIYGRAAMDLPSYQKEHFVFLLQLFRGTCDFENLERLGNVWENAKHVPVNALSAMFLDLCVFSETDEDHQKFFDLVCKWGELATQSAARMPIPARERHAPREKLRIGWLSSDLRSHSVSKFLMPLIQKYDRSRFEFYCYCPVYSQVDTIQNLIRKNVDKFTFVNEKSDREIAVIIQDDEVDILLELNGFTHGARLEVVAHKPAPVQMSWLGYPFSCGMKEIDHILLNRYLDGPKEQKYLVEEPVDMPESWVCFGQFAEAPILPGLPVDRNDGVFTFGTLNNVYKYTPRMISNWAEVMKRVPNSRFMIVRQEAGSIAVCQNIIKEFGKCGIEPDRLFFFNNHVKNARRKKHLDYYNEIDLSLDTFPLTGGTTTCEAVWMGVPVVSLVGDLFHQRLSYSVLAQCGLEDFCTTDDASFIERAVQAANDCDRLRYLRHSLREVVANSPLCDGDRFVFQFQEMLEAVAAHHNLRS